MGTLLTVLILIVSVFLGVIVLVQNPKGGGLGSGFGNVNQLGGVKRTADFLEKATWGLAIGLVILCLFSSGHLASTRDGGFDNIQGEEELLQAPIQESAPVPDEASEELE